MDLSKIPKELLSKRDIIECNFIMMFYKDITLLSDYKNIKNEEDIITNDGRFYFSLINGLYNKGIQMADNISIYAFLEDKPNIKATFEEKGGYKSIQEITELLNISNIDNYYDELVKSNLLIRLYDKGFNVMQNLEKFEKMDSEQVYDFFEYQLADVSTDKIEKIKVEDLTTGYDEWISEWNEGNTVGYKISSNMLNHQLLGVHKKNLLLHLTGIGNGKTTSAIHWYIIPSLIHGENVCILANEQGVSEWRQMILSTVLFNKIGNVKGFSRHKMLLGNYEDEHIEKMKQAAQWLKNLKGKLIFIELQDYSINNIKKILKKYSKINYGLFVVDTLKPEDDSSAKSWGEFSEVAKELFLQAKNLDVAVIATCQLSPEAMYRKYLDLTCIAKAKAIAETASQVVMFRNITSEEKEKIEGYIYEGKIKKKISLEQNKDYIMVFTPKNRFGQVNPQIIMERNMNFNTYKDLCWYDCPYDNFRKN